MFYLYCSNIAASPDTQPITVCFKSSCCNYNCCLILVNDQMDRNGNEATSPSHDWKSSKQGKKLIGIDGYWYDITNFIPYHPGGKVIEQFVGKDASAVFHGFHRQSVLRHRKPYARMNETSVENSRVSQAFAHLGQYFEKEGYFVTDYYWYAKKFLVTFLMICCVVYIVTNYPTSDRVYLGAVALAAFWQQCGFFMHDFEHNQFSQNRHIDKWLGTFFGTFCFGISGSWWRDEHFIHHALTTCVDHDIGFADPQMMEAVVWAQNEKLWPFYQNRLSYFLIRIQHITFLPLCVFMGRLAIIKASMVQERRLIEWAAFGLHWVWICVLLSYLPTWKHVFIFYGIASTIQGVLHIQLLISHYAKDYHHVKNVSKDVNWAQMQVESNIDIITPLWLDWFHGGLNFHLVHHLYPRMPRHNYRKATEYVRKVCHEYNLHYDHCGWFEAVKRTLSQLKRMSEHFSLDPNS